MTLVISLTCVGCATHVVLPSPPSREMSQARVDYCEAMRPVARSIRTGPTVVHARGGRHRFVESGIELRDGTFVTAPGDLLPVVGLASHAGIAARAAEDWQGVADVANAVTLTTFLTGAALLTWQTMPEELSALSSEQREGVLAAGLVFLALTPVSLGVVVLTSSRAGELRADAFTRYESHFDEGRCLGENARSASDVPSPRAAASETRSFR